MKAHAGDRSDKTAEVRDTLLADPRLRTVEVDWASGIILCVRTHHG
ncbi:MAG: hypothetical protein H6512_09030 [Acidimicrobiia bacterium]|nr:hypothetical protein [Acidimicrobiia bacterium]